MDVHVLRIVCAVLRHSTIPVSVALAELADVLEQPEAAHDLAGLLRAWVDVCMGQVKPDDVALAFEATYRPRREAVANATERQRVALELAQSQGAVCAADLREECPGLSGEAYRATLVSLVECGLLVRRGRKRGAHYVPNG